MKISVITAAYNAEATIADTLRSVAMQDFPDSEHVVVDGASRDRTVAVVKPLLRPQDRLVSEPDRGIYDAMNKGVAQATGDVIGFLNADDMYADERCLTDIAAAFDDPTIDAVFGDIDFVHPSDPGRVVRRYSSRRFTPARLASGWMPAHPSLYLRRQVFEACGPMRIDYRIGADFEYCVRVFKNPAIRYRYLDRSLVRMRTGGASTRGLGSTVTINREILRALRENGVPVSWTGLLLKYFEKLTELRPFSR